MGFPLSLHPTSPQRHSIRLATVQSPISTIRCKTLNNFSKVCYSLPCILSPILARSFRRRFVRRSLPDIATFGCADVPIPLPPILRTLFQVPYPATPLFATLTKTPGVWGYSSHSGTSSLPLPRPCPSRRSPTPFPASLPHYHIPSSPLSPLAATLIDPPASVANKRLTAWLNPLVATLTKKRGEGSRLLLTRSPIGIPVPRGRTTFLLSPTGHGKQDRGHESPLTTHQITAHFTSSDCNLAFTRKGSSNSVISPQPLPRTGSSRAESGLCHFTARLAMSPIISAS